MQMSALKSFPQTLSSYNVSNQTPMTEVKHGLRMFTTSKHDFRERPEESWQILDFLID